MSIISKLPNVKTTISTVMSQLSDRAQGIKPVAGLS